MGKASRKKWERRIHQPLETVKHIDAKKLAHRAAVYRRAHPLRSTSTTAKGS